MAVAAARLDVPAQAERYARELRGQATERAARWYGEARRAAPDVVVETFDAGLAAIEPYAARVKPHVARAFGPDRKRTLMITGGAFAGLLMLRRVRRSP